MHRPPSAINDQQIVAMVDAISRDDWGYQWNVHARPNTGGHEDFDVHHSLLREVIIKRQPTGSDAYDFLFGIIADRLVEDPAIFLHERSMLHHLPECWEMAHPGESFYPTTAELH